MLTQTLDGHRVPTHVERWSARWEWRRRADAWDDERDRLDHAARREALRTDARANDQRALGGVAMHKALFALEALPVDHIPAGAAVRLLDVGARLERRHAHGLSRRAPGARPCRSPCPPRIRGRTPPAN